MCLQPWQQEVHCQHSGRLVLRSRCYETILAIETPNQLGVCLACEVGQALKALSPHWVSVQDTEVRAQDLSDKVQDAKSKVLQDIFNVIGNRYRNDKVFGIRFLRRVGETLGFSGISEDQVEQEARALGLTLVRRPVWGIQNDQIFKDSGLLPAKRGKRS